MPAKTVIPKSDLFSVSELAKRFQLDRATVTKRLEKVKPVSEAANKKLYDIAEVEDLLSEDALDEAKLAKLNTERELKEHQLKVARGEYAPVDEFKDIVQRIFSNLHKRLAVQLPRKLTRKLLHANSETEINEILGSNISTVFDELRTDYKKFL